MEYIINVLEAILNTMKRTWSVLLDKPYLIALYFVVIAIVLALSYYDDKKGSEA